LIRIGFSIAIVIAIEMVKPGSDFKIKTGDQFRSEVRSSIFSERFLIGIVIAIEIVKSLIDFRTKIGIRFCVLSVLMILKLFFNRGSISI